jgi:hypothetical protein
MQIRDRIKELRRVPASELHRNPANFRKHSQAQQQAMREMLDSVGYVDALMAWESPNGLELLDGHMRADIDPTATVPVLIVDVNEHEAANILATFDPIGQMAQNSRKELDALLSRVTVSTEGIGDMLSKISSFKLPKSNIPDNRPTLATVSESSPSQPSDSASQSTEKPKLNSGPATQLITIVTTAAVIKKWQQYKASISLTQDAAAFAKLMESIEC